MPNDSPVPSGQASSPSSTKPSTSPSFNTPDVAMFWPSVLPSPLPIILSFTNGLCNPAARNPGSRDSYTSTIINRPTSPYDTYHYTPQLGRSKKPKRKPSGQAIRGRAPSRSMEQIYPCDICGKASTTLNDRLRHQKSVHKVTRPGDKMWKCRVKGCPSQSKEWSRLDNFLTHVSSNHGPDYVDEAKCWFRICDTGPVDAAALASVHPLETIITPSCTTRNVQHPSMEKDNFDADTIQSYAKRTKSADEDSLDVSLLSDMAALGTDLSEQVFTGTDNTTTSHTRSRSTPLHLDSPISLPSIKVRNASICRGSRDSGYESASSSGETLGSLSLSQRPLLCQPIPSLPLSDLSGRAKSFDASIPLICQRRKRRLSPVNWTETQKVRHIQVCDQCNGSQQSCIHRSQLDSAIDRYMRDTSEKKPYLLKGCVEPSSSPLSEKTLISFDSEGEKAFVENTGDEEVDHLSPQEQCAAVTIGNIAAWLFYRLTSDDITRIAEAFAEHNDSDKYSQPDPPQPSDASKISSSRKRVYGDRNPSWKDDDGHEDDSGNEEDNGRRPSTTKRKKTEQRRYLACPYYKYDPFRYSKHNKRRSEQNYRSCSSCLTDDIAKLKQHLYRTHKRPELYCPKCWKIFDDDVKRDEHIQTCDSIQMECPFSEKMTDKTYKEIKKKEKGAAWDLWFDIFKLLFPGFLPLPLNAYADDQETILYFINVFRALGAVTARAFYERSTSNHVNASGHSLDSPTKSIMEAAFLQFCLIVDRKLPANYRFEKREPGFSVILPQSGPSKVPDSAVDMQSVATTSSILPQRHSHDLWNQLSDNLRTRQIQHGISGVGLHNVPSSSPMQQSLGSQATIYSQQAMPNMYDSGSSGRPAQLPNDMQSFDNRLDRDDETRNQWNDDDIENLFNNTMTDWDQTDFTETNAYTAATDGAFGM